MKYVCKICGFIYDEEKQAAPFDELPDSWVCPLCGAAKSDFEPQGAAKKAEMPKTPVKVDTDMKKLSVAELSALCSNLARGCEMQYKPEAADLFHHLAEYFAQITPTVVIAETTEITQLIKNDLDSGYETIRAVASEAQDRGALRVCVWGEKVTRMLNTLLQRYEKEGEAFLADTEIWVCTVCGFVYIGDNPPGLCPVCKVPSWKFEKTERGLRA